MSEDVAEEVTLAEDLGVLGDVFRVRHIDEPYDLPLLGTVDEDLEDAFNRYLSRRAISFDTIYVTHGVYVDAFKVLGDSTLLHVETKPIGLGVCFQSELDGAE